MADKRKQAVSSGKRPQQSTRPSSVSVKPSSSKRRPPPKKQAPSGSRPPPNPRQAASRQRPQDSRTSTRGRSLNRYEDPRERQINATQQRRKRKRKRNYTLYYIILFFFLTVTGITLSLTVFFNIKTIEVVGSELYTASDVLPILGAKEGDNLFRINSETLRQNVLDALPRSDKVSVSRVFPSKLRITVTDGKPNVQMESDERYYCFSQSGRVLEIRDEPTPENGVLVLGLPLSGLQVGDYVTSLVEFEESDSSQVQERAKEIKGKLQSLKAFFKALEEARVSNVNAVDVTDELKISFYWENRMQIILGSFSELSYKLEFCKSILEDSSRITVDSIGILDAQDPASGVILRTDEVDLVIPGGGKGGVWNWDDGKDEEDENAQSSSDETSSPESDLADPLAGEPTNGSDPIPPDSSKEASDVSA